MIKDAALTFLPSVRQQNKKRQTESQSSDFIQMSLSANQWKYLNTITEYADHMLRTKEQTATPCTKPLDHIWCWLACNTIAILL